MDNPSDDPVALRQRILELEAALADRPLVDPYYLEMERCLNNLAEGVFAVGNAYEGTISYANPAFARILGYPSAREAIGGSVLGTFNDPRERAETFARFLADPEFRRTGTLRFLAKRKRVDTGEPLDVVIVLQATFGEDGRPTRFDCTMEPDDERARAAIQFRDGEARFRLIFDNSSIGFVLMTPGGVLTRVNAALCQFLNRTENELLNQPFDRFLHPEDQHRGSVSHSEPRPDQATSPRHQELRFVRADGQSVWGHVTLSWLRDDQGQPLHAVQMIQDITTRRRMEEELLRMEKLESLAVLAGGIAHDFNNILAVILGNVSMAQMDALGDSKECLSQAEAATIRARDLTLQLMTFAKGGSPVRRTGPIQGVIRESASLCLRGAPVRYRITAPDDLEPVDFDPGQMSQVFNNLFLNAIQAMPKGGDVTVEACTCVLGTDDALPLDPGTYVRVTVTDQGTGIPAAHMSRIFDPFFSTKPGGSGLGLATAYSIVRRHDGHIMAESRPGEGARFVLYLPVSGRRIPVRKAADTQPRPAPLEGRILVMDDEQLVRNATVALLRCMGLEAVGVESGEQALQEYQAARDGNTPYHAVILDLTVPGGMGGAETLPRLRELDPRVRAIVSSGYSSDPVMSRSAELGFAGVVAKPYTPDELRQVLVQVLSAGNPG